MGKEDRRDRVLRLLVETDLALPPTVIFYNAKDRGADFEQRSVINYIEELVSLGYVEKVDAKRGYYAATGKGRQYIESNT